MRTNKEEQWSEIRGLSFELIERYVYHGELQKSGRIARLQPALSHCRKTLVYYRTNIRSPLLQPSNSQLQAAFQHAYDNSQGRCTLYVKSTPHSPPGTPKRFSQLGAITDFSLSTWACSLTCLPYTLQYYQYIIGIYGRWKKMVQVQNCTVSLEQTNSFFLKFTIWIFFY